MKPKHESGYGPEHTELCERTLVTLLRGLGPWKQGLYLTGGLVPRYLVPRPAGSELPQHVGTTDVDLVLDIEVLAEVEAYRKLVKNIEDLGFERGKNDEGQVQHFSWRRRMEDGLTTVVLDLLCDADLSEGGQVVKLPGERRLSALKVPGARLVIEDHLEVELTVELLEERGVVREKARVANIVPFVVLKALAFDDRGEEKDAYDLVYCLMYYRGGPEDVASAFAGWLRRAPDEPLLPRAVEILRGRFASDSHVHGAMKDGPTAYARFRTNPGRTDLNAVRRQDAVAAVEAFLARLHELSGSAAP
jgi:hypothetical protein